MPTSESPETELTPELIDRVLKLSPESRGRLLELICETDLPPGPDDAEVRRRLQEVINGTVRTLSREEADEAVRRALRSQGVEL